MVGEVRRRFRRLMNRLLDQAARAFADQATQQLRDIPSVRAVVLSVTSTTGGLFLSWRGATVSAKRCASFTPAAGDRVLCLVVQDQIVVIDQIV